MDSTAAIIASVVAGIAGGFLSSWMAFSSSGEKFDPRKHGNALITGALSGMALGLGLVASAAEGAAKTLTSAQVAIGLFTIFLSAAGIDRLRSSGSHMITPTKTDPKAKTATTTATPTTTTSTTKQEEVKQETK